MRVAIGGRDLKPGEELKSLTRAITQDVIDAYAGAVNDFNPIHVDQEYAKRSMFGSTTAHGFLLVAYLGTMLRQNFGPDWFKGSRLGVRFRRPAKPGDDLSLGGVVDQITDRGLVATVWVKNQQGKEIITGQAEIAAPREG